MSVNNYMEFEDGRMAPTKLRENKMCMTLDELQQVNQPSCQAFTVQADKLPVSQVV